MAEKQSALNSVVLPFKELPCTDCGKHYPPVCMEFDHVRGVKAYDVSDMRGFPKQAILAEIAKCEIVCSNCHAIRTDQRRKAHSKANDDRSL